MPRQNRLSPALVAKAKSTAESIAALMQDDRVRAEHIAEAFFYRPTVSGV